MTSVAYYRKLVPVVVVRAFPLEKIVLVGDSKD